MATFPDAAERSIDLAFHQLNATNGLTGQALRARRRPADPASTHGVHRIPRQQPRGSHDTVRYDLSRHFDVTPEELTVGLHKALAASTVASVVPLSEVQIVIILRSVR